MKKMPLICVLSIVVFATGCPQRPTIDYKNTNSFVSQTNEYLKTEYAKYDAAVAQGNTAKAQQIRNSAIEMALGVIDDNYAGYINSIETRRSTSDFVADVVELGTGAAIGITKGERANQILGIALTAFRGGRRSSELNFYKQQTTPILINKMDDNRSTIYATILLKKGKDVNEYGWYEAIRDIVAYYNAGTLVRAFSQLSKATAAQAQESENRVLRLKNIDPSTIVNMSSDTRKSAIRITNHLRSFEDLLDSGSASVKAETTERLRLIYLDVVKTGEFTAVLDQVRKTKPDFKRNMASLEADETASKSVAGTDIEEVLFQIFHALDLNKQGPLVIKFEDIIDARVSAVRLHLDDLPIGFTSASMFPGITQTAVAD